MPLYSTNPAPAPGLPEWIARIPRWWDVTATSATWPADECAWCHAGRASSARIYATPRPSVAYGVDYVECCCECAPEALLWAVAGSIDGSTVHVEYVAGGGAA